MNWYSDLHILIKQTVLWVLFVLWFRNSIFRIVDDHYADTKLTDLTGIRIKMTRENKKCLKMLQMESNAFWLGSESENVLKMIPLETPLFYIIDYILTFYSQNSWMYIKQYNIYKYAMNNNQ